MHFQQQRGAATEFYFVICIHIQISNLNTGMQISNLNIEISILNFQISILNIQIKKENSVAAPRFRNNA